MASRSKIELLWPDGAVTSGWNWPEVEAAVRAQQPVSFASRRDFRREMRHRAKVWSGIYPTPKGPQTARAFIQSLADCGLFMIVITEEDNDE